MFLLTGLHQPRPIRLHVLCVNDVIPVVLLTGTTPRSLCGRPNTCALVDRSSSTTARTTPPAYLSSAFLSPIPACRVRFSPQISPARASHRHGGPCRPMQRSRAPVFVDFECDLDFDTSDQKGGGHLAMAAPCNPRALPGCVVIPWHCRYGFVTAENHHDAVVLTRDDVFAQRRTSTAAPIDLALLAFIEVRSLLRDCEARPGPAYRGYMPPPPLRQRSLRFRAHLTTPSEQGSSRFEPIVYMRHPPNTGY